MPQVAPGCVQLSSGRIARPTPKTAPSRAPSAELSENFPCDGEAPDSSAQSQCRDWAFSMQRHCGLIRSAYEAYGVCGAQLQSDSTFRAGITPWCACAEGKACGGKRRGARLSKASAEKAAKRRRLVGGLLKTVGAAAPGQQCTQCGTQVRSRARLLWSRPPTAGVMLCS